MAMYRCMECVCIGVWNVCEWVCRMCVNGWIDGFVCVLVCLWMH